MVDAMSSLLEPIISIIGVMVGGLVVAMHPLYFQTRFRLLGKPTWNTYRTVVSAAPGSGAWVIGRQLQCGYSSIPADDGSGLGAECALEGQTSPNEERPMSIVLHHRAAINARHHPSCRSQSSAICFYVAAVPSANPHKHPIPHCRTLPPHNAVIWRFGFTVAGCAAVIMSWALLALTIDPKHDIRRHHPPLLWLGCYWNAGGVFTDTVSSVIGAAAGCFHGSFIYSFRLADRKEGMGFATSNYSRSLAPGWVGSNRYSVVPLAGAIAGGR
jgi:hypothetical protein